jgi:GAF domain-containing protein
MAEELIFTKNSTRESIYQEIIPQIKAVLADETDIIANMANVAAILRQAFGFFWVGFYRNVDNVLVLSPFQGPLACTRIAFERGVCGASATQQKTLIVPDVEKFPGHIACSSASKSEIVLPFVKNGKTHFVLDVDSDILNDFSETDEKYLSEIVNFLGNLHL